MINRPPIHLLCLLALAGLSNTAQAGLLGLQQAYPDVTLNQAYLIYDNNAIDSSTGLLKLVAFSSTLNEGPASGNSTLTQTYTDNFEHTPDLMLSIAIDRTTGNWVNNSSNNANKVSIGFGNSVIANGTGNTPGFSWSGNITGFGWQQNTASAAYGSFFDASWEITQDNYVDTPASLNQFVDNVLSNALTPKGGIKISNSAGFNNTSHPIAFQRDWVFGANADNAMVQNLLSPFLTNLSTNTCNSSSSTNCMTYLNSTVMSDAFVVPIPAAFWLWAGALGVLLPSVRLRKITIF